MNNDYLPLPRVEPLIEVVLRTELEYNGASVFLMKLSTAVLPINNFGSNTFPSQ